MNAKTVYLSKCVGTARRVLMLPHPEGEASDIAHAMSEISLGLHGFDASSIGNEDARRLLKQITEAMDVAGLEDPDGRGLNYVKADQMSIDERAAFSHAVSELSSYLDDED